MSNRDNVIKFASLRKSDISGHLLQIYDTVIKRSPKIMVELGVRKGISTFALSMAAQDIGAKLTSVDIEDCSKFCNHSKMLSTSQSVKQFPAKAGHYAKADSLSNWDKWEFVKMNDLDFADTFKDKIDVLFIDTSHTLDHTIKELRKFLPKMNKQGIIIMHDTNIPHPKVKSGVGEAIDIIFGIKGIWKTNFELKIDKDKAKVKIVNFAHSNGMAFIFLG